MKKQIRYVRELNRRVDGKKSQDRSSFNEIDEKFSIILPFMSALFHLVISKKYTMTRVIPVAAFDVGSK